MGVSRQVFHFEVVELKERGAERWGRSEREGWFFFEPSGRSFCLSRPYLSVCANVATTVFVCFVDERTIVQGVKCIMYLNARPS